MSDADSCSEHSAKTLVSGSDTSTGCNISSVSSLWSMMNWKIKQSLLEMELLFQLNIGSISY